MSQSTASNYTRQLPSALGQLVAASSMSVVIASDQTAIPVSGTFYQATQPVSLATLPALTAGTAAIGKLAANSGVDIGDVTLTAGTASIGVLGANSGVDIGDVTINNASGASAVNIQDGGNSITVDGTVTANAGSGTMNIAGAVTNAGTFAVQDSRWQLEDDVASSGAYGAPILGVRNDSGATRTTLDGDYGMVALDAAGRVGITDLGSSISIDDGGSSITVDPNGGSMAVSGTVAVSSVAGTVAATLGANSGVDIGDVTINNSTGALAVNVQDGGNSLTVDDGGSSLTVDGSVSITGSLPAGTNAIGKLAANAGVNIGDVGIGTVTPGTSAANLGKAQDAAAAPSDTGVMMLGVRNDDATTSWASTNGDYNAVAVDQQGKVFITAGTAGLPVTDNGTTLSVDDGAGSLTIDDGGSSITVDGTLTGVTTVSSVTGLLNITGSVVPGTASTHLGKAEDAAHTSGDTGVMMLAVRNDTAGTVLAGADGDYIPPTTNNKGAVRVIADSSTGAQSSVAASITSVTLLASNVSRRGATIYNDSTEALYMILGTPASTVLFTCKIASQGYYEVPFGYVGQICGIWGSATGSARITEVT